MGQYIEEYSWEELGRIRVPGRSVPALFWALPVGEWEPAKLNEFCDYFVLDRLFEQIKAATCLLKYHRSGKHIFTISGCPGSIGVVTGISAKGFALEINNDKRNCNQSVNWVELGQTFRFC